MNELSTEATRSATPASKAIIDTESPYSQPRPEDEIGKDYNSVVRVDGALLASLVANLEAQYYLCGPTRFMADVQTDLERRGIPADHIHTESFGPTR